MDFELPADLTPTTDIFTLRNLVTWLSASAMMFGGVVPYVPQYREIRKTDNAEGFSSYVCLILLVANTLRIIFWFGHPFELPLLLQSIIMNIAMLAMIQLCVHTRNKTMIVPTKSNFFADFDLNFFWEWTDFLSYLECLATFTALVGIIMYFCIDVIFIVESIGFVAVFIEAMLGAPQFYRNLRKKSTFGMSKKMVLLWVLGDLYKTTYFVIREAPSQFWVCGILQIGIDCSILLQVFIYRVSSSPVKLLLKGETHKS